MKNQRCGYFDSARYHKTLQMHKDVIEFTQACFMLCRLTIYEQS